MKKNKAYIPLFCLLILLCLFLNWGGDQLVSRWNWPVWLDSFGTMLTAYLLGPWCAAIVGATTNILGYILYGIPWWYALVSIMIGLIAGFAAKKKWLDHLLGTLTTGAIMAAAIAAAAYPINLILNGGSTGNNWGDAVIGFLGEAGIPSWTSLFIGELYVELIDKVIILIVLHVIIRIVKLICRKLKKDEAGPEEETDGSVSAVVKATALLLAAGLGVSALGTVIPAAKAEESAPAFEINYNDYVQTIYSSTNGLPCGEANDIAITGDGIILIGTYAGLYRYNGRNQSRPSSGIPVRYSGTGRHRYRSR